MTTTAFVLSKFAEQYNAAPDGVILKANTEIVSVASQEMSSETYQSKQISSNTTIQANCHYLTGSYLQINNDAFLIIPESTKLEISIYNSRQIF